MSGSKQKPQNRQHYFTVWRWHFYSGIFIAPFLIILACSAPVSYTHLTLPTILRV